MLCLPNGDLLLAMGTNIFDATNPEKDRHTGLGLYILTKDKPNSPFPLNVVCEEGPAVSKNSMKIAWTLVGQREIKMSEIFYENGVPELKDEQTIISYKDSSAYVRLETQDFRQPLNEELKLSQNISSAWQTTHIETNETQLKPLNGTLSVNFNPYQIKTIRLFPEAK